MPGITSTNPTAWPPVARLAAVAQWRRDRRRRREERFGAVVASIGPGTLGLSVAAPPTTAAKAHSLAAEQAAFAPEGDDGDDLDAVAAKLPDRGVWSFGWPD
jgi:hypothetical protein